MRTALVCLKMPPTVAALTETTFSRRCGAVDGRGDVCKCRRPRNGGVCSLLVVVLLSLKREAPTPGIPSENFGWEVSRGRRSGGPFSVAAGGCCLGGVALLCKARCWTASAVVAALDGNPPADSKSWSNFTLAGLSSKDTSADGVRWKASMASCWLWERTEPMLLMPLATLVARDTMRSPLDLLWFAESTGELGEPPACLSVASVSVNLGLLRPREASSGCVEVFGGLGRKPGLELCVDASLAGSCEGSEACEASKPQASSTRDSGPKLLCVAKSDPSQGLHSLKVASAAEARDRVRSLRLRAGGPQLPGATSSAHSGAASRVTGSVFDAVKYGELDAAAAACSACAGSAAAGACGQGPHVSNTRAAVPEDKQDCACNS